MFGGSAKRADFQEEQDGESSDDGGTVDYLLVAAELASPLESRVADAVAPEATVTGVVVLPVAALVAVLALQAALLADVQDVADLTSTRGAWSWWSTDRRHEVQWRQVLRVSVLHGQRYDQWSPLQYNRAPPTSVLSRTECWSLYGRSDGWLLLSVSTLERALKRLFNARLCCYYGFFCFGHSVAVLESPFIENNRPSVEHFKHVPAIASGGDRLGDQKEKRSIDEDRDFSADVDWLHIMLDIRWKMKGIIL
ncbi:hypothetical protein TYRP_015147 [Tyrophagus putrescentiae]|nr:hypothetical protein TYRP_015147 [Tyrophagus putrescentiae]